MLISHTMSNKLTFENLKKLPFSELIMNLQSKNNFFQFSLSNLVI